MSLTKCRRPVTTLPPPLSIAAFSAAGFSSGLFLVLHKNTVQYRIRRAEESLGRPVSDSRHDVELALQASYWLGPAVLRPAAAPAAAGEPRGIPDSSGSPISG
jgi:hypothetical protein